MKRKSYKKNVTSKLTKNINTKEVALKELNKEISQVNSMLSNLKREHKTKTWASKKLYNRLTNAKLKKVWNYKTDNIRHLNNLNMTQITNIRKALNQFKASATSTNAGIRDVKNRTLESLKNTISLDRDVSDSEVEDMYSMLSDKDFSSFLRLDQSAASTLWDLVADAQEYNESKDTFVDKLLRNMNVNDVDSREKAKRIYDNFVI